MPMIQLNHLDEDGKPQQFALRTANIWMVKPHPDRGCMVFAPAEDEGHFHVEETYEEVLREIDLLEAAQQPVS